MTDTKTVLIFEDNDADYFLLQAMFEDIRTDDYTLIRAEGLGDFDKTLIPSIDLVIMDYQLPQNTGLEIIEELQEMFGNFAPIIFLTGHDNPHLYKQLRSLNVYDHFIKEEMTASLLERSCFYAIERFLTNERYRREREFSQYLTENLPYIIVKVSDTGDLEKYNDNFLRIQKDIQTSTTNNYDALIDLFKSKQTQFTFNYSKGTERCYTKWQLIQSQFDDTITYIGEDVTKEVNERENEIGRKKLEALGHLAGGIAHELNNTLQPIILRNDLMKDIGITLNNQPLIDHAEENSLMLKHGAAIIRDILDFSNSKDTDSLDQSTNIAPIFHSAISIIQKSLPVTITINLHQEDILITTHIVPFDETNHLLKISIKDQGCGMSEHLIEKIFSPFFTTRPPGAGTGLGMSVTHSLITKYSGDIQVQSVEGLGTTIHILLPISKDL